MVGLCYMLCVTVSLFTLDASAQGDSAGTKNNDKDLATKRGVADSLASPTGKREVFDADTGRMVTVGEDEVDPNKPTPLKMAIGLGSIPVAYIVLKFL